MHSHFSNLLLSITSAVAAGYLLYGTTGMLAAASTVLLLWLLLHLYQINRLYHWLQNPKLSTIPQAHGIWRKIFDTLLLQAKSRKKRKQKLASALLRLNRIAEAMPNGVLLLDAEGRIEWFNLPAAQHLGLDSSQDRNGMLKNLVRTPQFHTFLQATDIPETHEIGIQMHDTHGQRSILITRSTFDKDQTLLVTQDITATERLNAVRTDFVANVSHELRTPLTVINGFLETLTDIPDMPRRQQQEFLGLMQQEGSRMLNLIADLLTLSRLESPQSEENCQTLDLSALIRQTSEDARSLSQGKHHFATDIAEDIWINGIPLDLYNAFSNLVFNAVRYTPEGGSIRIRLQAENTTHVRFSVTDTGPGIASEHLPRLTERFYRVDSGRARHNGGTGLGLAITKHALAKHHSTLEIESRPGHGSTFSALLETCPSPTPCTPPSETTDTKP